VVLHDYALYKSTFTLLYFTWCCKYLTCLLHSLFNLLVIELSLLGLVLDLVNQRPSSFCAMTSLVESHDS